MGKQLVEQGAVSVRTKLVLPQAARLIDKWQIGTEVSTELVALLPLAILEAEALNAGAGVKAVAVIVHQACAQYDKPDTEQYEAFMDATIDALKDVPTDLVELSAKTVVRTWRGRAMPTTGYWMSTISDERHQRAQLLRRLVLARDTDRLRDEREDAVSKPYRVAREFVAGGSPLALRARDEGFTWELEHWIRETGNTEPSCRRVEAWKQGSGWSGMGKTVSASGEAVKGRERGVYRQNMGALKHVTETLPAFIEARRVWDEEHDFKTPEPDG